MASSSAPAADKVDKARSNGNFGEIGKTGLIQYAGLINEKESIPELRDGSRAREMFKEMSDNDATVGSILFAVEMLVRQVEWTVEPADVKAIADSAAEQMPTATEEEANRISEHVGSCLEDMSQSWEDTLAQILSMLPFGWSYLELVYKRRQGYDVPATTPSSKYSDGLIGWRKIPIRSQDSIWKWEFDGDGGIAGMWQLDPETAEPLLIPISKALLFRTSNHKGSPEGRSILRTAYRSWYMKKRIEEIEGIGIERDLAGLPLMYVPPPWLDPSNENADEVAARSNAQKIVRNVKRDANEGMLLPSYFDDEGNRLLELILLTTGGRRQFDTNEIVTRYAKAIAMSILADFIMLGHDKVGSYSLGASKVDLFQIALGAWLDSIADVFNSHAIPRLVRLNGWDVRLAPTLTPSPVESIDLGMLGEFIGKTAGAGMPWFPHEGTESYLRGVAGAPEREEAEQL